MAEDVLVISRRGRLWELWDSTAWRVAASATSIHSAPLSAAWRQPSSAGTCPGNTASALPDRRTASSI